jgi:hypothetical protein
LFKTAILVAMLDRCTAESKILGELRDRRR